MRRIVVQSSAGSYAVVLGSGAIRRAQAELRGLGKATSVQVVSSPRVWRHAGAAVRRAFSGAATKPILFDDREAAKNLRTVENLCRALLRAGADRRTVLVAVGGGVVGDVAGFAAASYLRGVRVVQVPTTIVAVADSSIGGKTGVNLPEGKNQVGAFYPPCLVLADTDLLRTLPDREFRSGLYEIVKYGIIGDAPLFRFLEGNLESLVARKPAALEYALWRGVAQKSRVVSSDERESGLREILNYGHTFGHALETVTRYRRYLHGEAIGWGMLCAARLAVEHGLSSEAEAERISRLVLRVGPLPSWPRVSATRLIEAMRADKKSRGGRLRFVLATKIGHAETFEGVPEGTVRGVLEWIPRRVSSGAPGRD
ncbi:MAG: 3-dehydroquinate synthase [Candidatus Acidiferrales bacterium]